LALLRRDDPSAEEQAAAILIAHGLQDLQRILMVLTPKG
jgi:hypothetical protein